MERYDVKTVNKLTPEQVATACISTKRTVDPSAIVLDMGQNLAVSGNSGTWEKKDRK